MLKIFAPVLLAGLVMSGMPCQAADAQPGQPGQNCPGLNGQARPAQTRADARLQSVVQALKNNKQSAETLIDAAREAGASPETVAEMQKMSAAFRQFFMTVVQPEQIVEGILSDKGRADGNAGLLITAPDGSMWLVTPQMQPPMPPRIGHRPPLPPMPGQQFQPCSPPASQGAPMQGQQYKSLLPETPGIQLPPASALQGEGMKKAPGQQAPQQAQDMVIMEGRESSMPYWPTKQHLGKDGVLKYLEKRAQSAPM